MANSLRLNPPVFIDATSAVSLEIPKKNIVNVVICSAGTALSGSHGAVRVDEPPQPCCAALRCAALRLQRPTQGRRGRLQSAAVCKHSTALGGPVPAR